MVLELSERSWKVLFASASCGRRRERAVAGRDVAGLLDDVGSRQAPAWGCRRRRAW